MPWLRLGLRCFIVSASPPAPFTGGSPTNIRDLSFLERLPGLLDELIEARKPVAAVGTKCPHLSAEAARKASAKGPPQVVAAGHLLKYTRQDSNL